MSHTSEIIAFYLGDGKDSEGRNLVEILAFDNGELEFNHNYVQWLFPLAQKSAFNADAPVLTDNDIATFKGNEKLRANMLVALNKMLTFYGFKLIQNDEGVAIVLSDTFNAQKENWVSLGNHNLLRLTRILNSLNTLGLSDYAKAMFIALEQVYQANTSAIGTVTWNFWKQAIR